MHHGGTTRATLPVFEHAYAGLVSSGIRQGYETDVPRGMIGCGGGGHCCRLKTSHPGLLEFPVSWHDFQIKWVGFAWSHTEYIPGDRHGWIRRYLCCPGTYPAPLAQGHGQLSYVRLKVRKHVHHRGTIRARLAAFEHATCWFGTPRDTTGIRNRRAQRHDWVWVPCCRLETSHPGLLEFPVTWHEVRMKWVGFVWPHPSARESKVHLNGNQGTSRGHMGRPCM